MEAILSASTHPKVRFRWFLGLLSLTHLLHRKKGLFVILCWKFIPTQKEFPIAPTNLDGWSWYITPFVQARKDIYTSPCFTLVLRLTKTKEKEKLKLSPPKTFNFLDEGSPLRLTP
jgi:hypothetical protein